MSSALALLVAISAFVAACSGSEGEAVDASANLIDDAEPTVGVFDSGDSITLAGTSTDPSAIKAGECFNEYQYYDRSDFVQQIWTIVGCRGPHDSEAYFRTDFPAGETASYPLIDDLERWADTTCLDEFEGFVGLDYVLSELEIGAIVPTFENWTDAGDRAVICYLFPDQGGRLLDSVRNSGI